MTEIAQLHPLATRTDFQADRAPSLESVGADSSRPSERTPLNRTSCYARSFGNPHSRLFWCDGQLFCGLARGQAALFNNLETTGVIKDLAQTNLFAQVKPAEISVEGFDQVLRIVPTPRVSYVYEW